MLIIRICLICNWFSDQRSFGTKYETESELELSVLHLVPKHFRAESQLHMIRPLEYNDHEKKLKLHNVIV